MERGQGLDHDPVRELGERFTLGSGGACVCPICGFKIPQESGVQCYNKSCPKCGSIMTRAR